MKLTKDEAKILAYLLDHNKDALTTLSYNVYCAVEDLHWRLRYAAIDERRTTNPDENVEIAKAIGRFTQRFLQKPIE